MRDCFRPQLQALEERALPSSLWQQHLLEADAAAAARLEVLVRTQAQLGRPTAVYVRALLAPDRPAVHYTGTVHFIATDPRARVPADYTFRPRDHGAHVFQIVFGRTGKQTIHVMDVAASSSGAASTVVGRGPVATHFSVVALSPGSGSGASIVVTALDASNRRVRGYAGTVKLTSTDPNAQLPRPYTFRAADRGQHSFVVTPGSAGTQRIRAADLHDRAIAGAANLAVAFDSANQLVFVTNFFNSSPFGFPM